MTQPFRLTALVSASPLLPPAQAGAYLDLATWARLASTLERGRFDALILADHQSTPSSEGGAPVPRLDPFMLVTAMAHVTRHLGFAVTASTALEIPAVLARRLSTLDHLTDGRIGWSIVAGHADTEAEARGQGSGLARAADYDRADEFLHVAYRLWQDSWEDGSVVRDRASGVFADATKVHSISHHGAHFDLETVHLTEPSPQRTPLLLHAGASPEGRRFAARHAEAVLVAGDSPVDVATQVRDIRTQAPSFGRAPQDISALAILASLPANASPARVADHLEGWIEDADVDGFALALPPDALADFAGHVVPELLRRRLLGADDTELALRTRFGGTARLKQSHTGSRAVA
ncbi:hypothetical protein GCM10007301_17720 [Azorhizobium oxalatiphilum]|uniref:Luciferase-like domain-containing protein n=1 Tax=Azorhizobium oxalatiphilum TaxID=980631 RepID=A0A917F7T3_9HYPH|nr:NtaA/DmoA family FMN-dependent monooxygenase [Azorhizobium oxalatiphilum]GGF58505.1 hypothetical protein GCM10007301_17720 [Azorhizobium oxalatiphilum]